MYDPLIDTPSAAAWFGWDPRTLEARRSRGDGPPFVRLSRRSVRYRQSDLERWVTERTVRPQDSRTKPTEAGQ